MMYFTWKGRIVGMMRQIKVCEDIVVTLHDDKAGKSIVVMRQYGTVGPVAVQVTKDEAFKLAYALMSLASEL